MQKQAVIRKFRELFGPSPRVFVAPGRINIIGEHTDYNDGYVLPAAIDKAIYFAAMPNGQQRTCRLYAVDMGEGFEFSLDELKPKVGFWGTYVTGMCNQLQQNGYRLRGFDMVFGGDIPLGAGLSSSAALECGVGTALNAIFDLGIEKTDLVKMGQLTEHTFAGVNCGIMDQFASVMGKKDHVIRLDCRDLSYRYFPFRLGDYIVVLCDTRVKHELASSQYNTRRRECETGLEICKKLFGVASLRDVRMEDLEKNREKFPEKVYDRLHYVVGEVVRVERACEMMQAGDLEGAGRMMYATHRGLSQEYEVSCPELDFLVQQTQNDPDVIGARMMGGGFGGCTINLVKGSQADAFIDRIAKAYRERFGVEMRAYKTTVQDGCHEEKEEEKLS